MAQRLIPGGFSAGSLAGIYFVNTIIEKKIDNFPLGMKFLITGTSLMFGAASGAVLGGLAVYCWPITLIVASRYAVDKYIK